MLDQLGHGVQRLRHDQQFARALCRHDRVHLVDNQSHIRLAQAIADLDTLLGETRHQIRHSRHRLQCHIHSAHVAHASLRDNHRSSPVRGGRLLLDHGQAFPGQLLHELLQEHRHQLFVQRRIRQSIFM